MGKTTLAHAVIQAMDERIHVGYTATTTLSFVEMMRPAMLELGLGDRVDGKAQMLWGLTELLEIADQRGQIVALIVDEAHNLGPDAFEELRLLLNIETARNKLLQLVLVGQPELEDRLHEHALRHLADRVAVRCVLNPLSPKESAEYLRARLHSAGASHDLIAPAAARAILREARGVPRGINVLCHNALLFAFGEGRPRVEATHARTAIAERRGGRLKRLKPRRSRRPLLLAAMISAAIVVGLLSGILISGDLHLLPAPNTAAEAGERPPERGSTPFEGAPGPTGMPDGKVEDDSRSAGVEDAVTAQALPSPLGEGAGSRVIVVDRGSNLSSLMFEVYGDFNPGLLARVLAANPDIVDPDLLLPGQRVVLPEQP